MKTFILTLLTALFLGSSFAQLQLSTIHRENGTAFFSLHERSGQLSYMLDYGESSGTWTNFGDPVLAAGTGLFELAVNQRELGTAFFSLDNRTGQLYYMLDYGSAIGKWQAYGKTLDVSNGIAYHFEAKERTSGTAFFAQNLNSGQIYYMLDYGTNAGSWLSFGGTIP